MIDLTLRCPTCGRRADVCFDHGDDWKKRTARPGASREAKRQRGDGLHSDTGAAVAHLPTRDDRARVAAATATAMSAAADSRDPSS